MDNKIPLSVIMENARGKLIQAYNQVLDETKLPAYLMEGMLLELLSETRNRKNLELISDINAMQNKENAEEA
ncbi:hypothetical protein H8R91_06355 [Ruminococcus sp. NSJ-71]|jgi:hypothetical protein|uniref:Uncharacterized protein n=1 Tax=Ruminococcus intestinalis TaxID=2763066 RepID=A0ABR7HKZ0_9FIRM|nr:hypothetical protein [Ruminococcus intestinalis]MBC5728142.1 hypothetical protein [Ruminococcus intestinalis]